MTLDFWFDPICPFCWVTSRWVERVAPHRDLEVDWRPISLLYKNGIDDQPDHPYYPRAARTRDLLRVVEAARAAGHADRIGELYTEYGRFIHHRQELDFDVADVLDGLGLDPALAAALDDESWDVEIRAAMDEGLGLTGLDVGTPLLAFDGRDGRIGVFGPVIVDLPELDEALELWDGFVKMAENPTFFELKRTRNQSPNIPDESVLELAS